MIARLAQVFAAMSALGWVLALLLCLASLTGVAVATWMRDALFTAAFPIALAAIVLTFSAAGPVLTPGLAWRHALERGPHWMKLAMVGSMVLAIGLFASPYLGFAVPEMSTMMGLLSAFLAFATVVLWTNSESISASSRSKSTL
jgi:hypothetical protein